MSTIFLSAFNYLYKKPPYFTNYHSMKQKKRPDSSYFFIFHLTINAIDVNIRYTLKADLLNY